MVEKKRVLEEMTGDDLLWHHQRGTSCSVMGCDEPVRYSELHCILVGDRIAITYNFLCIADAMDAVNSGKAVIDREA